MNDYECNVGSKMVEPYIDFLDKLVLGLDVLALQCIIKSMIGYTPINSCMNECIVKKKLINEYYYH